MYIKICIYKIYNSYLFYACNTGLSCLPSKLSLTAEYPVPP